MEQVKLVFVDLFSCDKTLHEYLNTQTLMSFHHCIRLAGMGQEELRFTKSG